MKSFLIGLATLGLGVSLGACQAEPVPSDAAPAAPRTTVAADSPSGTPSDDALPADAPGQGYHFDRPDARFELAADLREISALTVLDEGRLGAVQDETGSLYVLSMSTGEIEAIVPFGPPGDYEGVELAEGRLFVLRSDGTLFEIEGWAGGDVRLRTYETGLANDCDAEGLGYDAGAHRLLIACKEDGGPNLGKRKAVYAFDVATHTLVPTPAFVIDPDRLPSGLGEKAHKMKPSALAVHPVTGALFVLSSKHDVLLALDAAGAVSDAWKLGGDGFEQPEGLAFLPNGDLFIASEGDDGPPILARFAYRAR